MLRRSCMYACALKACWRIMRFLCSHLKHLSHILAYNTYCAKQERHVNDRNVQRRSLVHSRLFHTNSARRVLKLSWRPCRCVSFCRRVLYALIAHQPAVTRNA